MAYVRHKVIIDLHYEKWFPGLNIAVVEPNGNMWEKVIIPQMDQEGAMEDPLKWIDVFIFCLDSWDLKEEDGTSTPCTRDGLMSKDLEFVRIVIRYWLNNAILVRRDELGNLVEAKKPEEEVTTKDMPVELIEDDPLRADVASTMDAPDGVVIPDEPPALVVN